MEEALFKFKGADWVGMVFGLIATYYLAKERRAGFVYGIIGGIGWVTFGFMTGSVAGVLANVCFISLNFRGYFRWKKKEEDGTRGQPDD